MLYCCKRSGAINSKMCCKRCVKTKNYVYGYVIVIIYYLGKARCFVERAFNTIKLPEEKGGLMAVERGAPVACKSLLFSQLVILFPSGIFIKVSFKSRTHFGFNSYNVRGSENRKVAFSVSAFDCCE